VVIDIASPHCEPLFSQFQNTGLPVLAVVNNADADFTKRYSSSRVKIQTEMVSVRSVAQPCKIVFGQADHDLAYEFLLMGVPFILLPNGIQNTLLTYRLAKKRLASAGPSKSSKLDVTALIETKRTVDQVWHNASRFSLKYENHSSLTRLHELIKTLCSKAA
jgi:hypothetical protein